MANLAMEKRSESIPLPVGRAIFGG